jgi:hypothetical protein
MYCFLAIVFDKFLVIESEIIKSVGQRIVLHPATGDKSDQVNAYTARALPLYPKLSLQNKSKL